MKANLVEDQPSRADRRMQEIVECLMPASPPRDDTRDTSLMRRSYLRVVVVWVLTLGGLFAFQRYFSAF
jgi:hypothetical protein